jgi:hypothetical protein
MQMVIKGLDKVLRQLDNVAKQAEYAMAVALTKTAQAAKDEMPRQLERDIDRPTPFTKGSFYIRPARKGQLEAIIGIRPKAAEYLRDNIFGGERDVKKLPRQIALNAYGNIPKGVIRQLVARAQAGKRLTKRQVERSGLSADDGLFYGAPRGGGPVGLWKRDGNRIVPVVIFPEVQGRYRPRFKFLETAQRVHRERFAKEFAAQFDKAMRTAK